MSRRSRRPIIWLFLGAALLLALAGAGALADAPPGSWPTVLFSSGFALPVTSGIQYGHLSLATTDGPLEIHELRVDLRNPTVRLGVALAHDRLMSDDETVSAMALRSGAIAGINGDYFDIHQSGIPLNIVLRDGQLLRSPWRWVALALGKDGLLRIVRFRWTGSVGLLESGERHVLDGYNSGLSPDGVVAISDIRGFGAPAPEPGMRQTVVELTPAGESGRYFVKQVWLQQAFYAPIPREEIILVGRGAGSDWLQGKMAAGAPVKVNLSTDPDWRDFQLAIGGGPVLVQNGQIVEDPDAPAPKERDRRYPVIAAGIGRDGETLTVIEVDGRQPGLSVGLTRPQLAVYMQRLGADQAMAFDSGGSATLVARLPGLPAPTVINSPSDGAERPVADALLIYSTAVPGPPAQLLVNANQPLRLFAGARAAVPVIGMDVRGTPTSLSDPVQFTAPPHLATVSPDGTVVAGASAGTGALRAQSGAARGAAPLSVITRLAHLVVFPDAMDAAPGAGWMLQLRGADDQGRVVALPQGGAAWAITPPWLGTVSASGEFVAGDASGVGVISAQLGGAVARARVAVGSARYVSEFDRGEWSFRGYPDTVTGSVGVASTPSHEGRPSAQLTYQLDGAGARAAYLVTHAPLPGTPTGITLWVYGDGSGVWLRGSYAQSTGELGTVTLARRVTWQGWRSVTSPLPSSVAYPITWITFYVVETEPARSPHGTIYLSSVRAIYPAGGR